MRYRICLGCSEDRVEFLRQKIRQQGKLCFLQKTSFSDFELVILSDEEISESEIDKILRI